MLQLHPPQPTDPSPEDAPALAPPSVFDRAASEVRERIGRDADRFADDEEAAALFEHLAGHLFDADLDVGNWRRSAGVSRAAYDRVKEELGSLKAYLDELRIAVAARLVRETETDLADVGRRVGYDTARTFRRAFKRRCGKSPKEMRRSREADAAPSPAAKVASPAGGTSAGGTSAGGVSEPPEAEASEACAAASEPAGAAEPPPRVLASRWRRRLALGLYDRRSVAELRRLLRQLYPCLREDAGRGAGEPAPLPAWVKRPVRILASDNPLSWTATQAIVLRLLRLPDAEMRQAFVDGLRFGELTGFQLLSQVSVALFLEHDAYKALQLAEIAAEMAEAHPESPAGETADWRALAWASLGVVRLRAGDRGGADAAFVFARAQWEAPRPEPRPLVEGQVCLFEAELRICQRRFDEAGALLDRVIELFRERKKDGLYTHCRLEQAKLARLVGDAARAVEILREIESSPLPPFSVPAPEQEAMYRCVVLHDLAQAHLAARSWEEAADCFAAARRHLCPEIEASYLAAEVDLSEARLSFHVGRLDSAARLLRSSRELFTQLGSPLKRALVTAELAAVCAFHGQREEAASEAATALETFEELPLHREALLAARLLRSIVEADEVPADRIEELRRHLDYVDREAGSLLRRRPADEPASGGEETGEEVEP